MWDGLGAGVAHSSIDPGNQRLVVGVIMFQNAVGLVGHEGSRQVAILILPQAQCLWRLTLSLNPSSGMLGVRLMLSCGGRM